MAAAAAILLAVTPLGVVGCRDDSTKPTAGGRDASRPPFPPATAPDGGAVRAKPLPAIEHVLLISVDGLRPDLIFRANAVHMIGLMNAGTFSLWGHTVDPPLTLPSHASMITGVKPERHGVTYNAYEPDQFPLRPTLFEEAKARGMTTALASGKQKLRVLTRPGSVDWLFAEDADAGPVSAEAARVLREHKPTFLMVHFSEVDRAGHGQGWGSPRQLIDVRAADDGVGRVVAAVDAAGLGGSTLVIVTADHGGAGEGHGPNNAGYTIPWIVRGPGVRVGYDLDRLGPPGVKTEDTFATVCAFLGIPLRPDLDGRPVLEIVDRTGQELLQSAP